MGGGNPPTTTINPAPVLRPADYRFGQSFWNNVMPHLLGRQLPQFTGQIDPGMGPTSQMAMQMAQGYGLSPSPYTMGQAQGLLGNIMGGGLNNWQYQQSPQAQNTLSRFMNPQMPNFGGTNFFGQGGSPWGGGGFGGGGTPDYGGYGGGRNPWGGSVPGDMGMGAFAGPMLGVPGFGISSGPGRGFDGASSMPYGGAYGDLTGAFGGGFDTGAIYGGNPQQGYSGGSYGTPDMPMGGGTTARMTAASPYPGPSGGIYNAPGMGGNGMIQTGTYYGQVGNPGEPGYRPAIPDPYGGPPTSSMLGPSGSMDTPPGQPPPTATSIGVPTPPSPTIYGDPPIMGGGPPVVPPSGPGAPPPPASDQTPPTAPPAPPANRPGAPAYEAWRRQMQGTAFGRHHGFGQDAYQQWLQWFNSRTPGAGGGGGGGGQRPGGGGNAGMGAGMPNRPTVALPTGGGGGFSAPLDNNSTTKGGIGALVGAMSQRPTTLPGTPKPRVPRGGPRPVTPPAPHSSSTSTRLINRGR